VVEDLPDKWRALSSHLRFATGKKKKGQVSVTHPAIWEGDIRRIAVPGLLRLENLI
jgi:hypothetical protein